MMRLSTWFLLSWSLLVLIMQLHLGSADVINVTASGSVSAAIPIFSPSGATSPGVYTAGLQTYAGSSAVEQQLLPLTLTAKSTSVSAIVLNATAIDITFVAAENASAYLSTLRVFQSSRGEFNTARAFAGAVLTSNSNVTTRLAVSTSPSEAYILLLQSTKNTTFGQYSLRTRGQGVDGIPGGLRVATLLLPGQSSVLGTIRDAATLTYIAQTSQMEGRNVSLFIFEEGKGRQVLNTAATALDTGFQPNQIVSPGGSSSVALNTSGQNVTIFAYASNSAMSNTLQAATTFTFDFTLTGSLATPAVPSVLATSGSTSFSATPSSGFVGNVLSQPGQDFNSATTRNAAAILGVAAVAPLPGTITGTAAQGPDGELRLGAFETPTVRPMPQLDGTIEVVGNPPTRNAIPPAGLPPAGLQVSPPPPLSSDTPMGAPTASQGQGGQVQSGSASNAPSMSPPPPATSTNQQPPPAPMDDSPPLMPIAMSPPPPQESIIMPPPVSDMPPATVLLPPPAGLN